MPQQNHPNNWWSILRKIPFNIEYSLTRSFRNPFTFITFFWWNQKAKTEVLEDKKEEGDETEENEVSFENGVAHRATKVQFAELAGSRKWLIISLLSNTFKKIQMIRASVIANQRSFWRTKSYFESYFTNCMIKRIIKDPLNRQKLLLFDRNPRRMPIYNQK